MCYDSLRVMDFLQENYPGVVVSWDVVNEAIDDGTAKLRVSNWTKVVGDDFVLTGCKEPEWEEKLK